MGLRELGAGAGEAGAKERALSGGQGGGWTLDLSIRLPITWPFWDFGSQACPAPQDTVPSSLPCLWPGHCRSP